MNENNEIKNLIIDMDGVLWRGETPLPGLLEFFEMIGKQNFGYVLATNNAMKTAVQYVEKLAGFGVDVPAQQILTSSEATAHYLRQSFPAGTSSYVVGESGLRDAMLAQDFDLIEAEDFVAADVQAEIVAVGMTRYACYQQLASAAHLINQGALFVGTNPDVTFPTEIGSLPGVGSYLAFLEAATGVSPLIIGKPNRGMFEEALLRLEGTTDDTVMVGDRLNTDIAGGHNAGLRTVLLLTGVTKKNDVDNTAIKPDWIVENLDGLASLLHRVVGT